MRYLHSKLNSNGNELIFSTYLGGPDDDGGLDLALGTAGEIYVCGYTNGDGFPTTNAYDDSFNGAGDGWILRATADFCYPTVTGVTRTPQSPTSADSATVTVGATDDVALNEVILQYRTDAGSWTDIEMALSGVTWTAIIPAMPSETDVEYRVYANDTAGNTVYSSIYAYTVTTVPTTTPTEPEPYWWVPLAAAMITVVGSIVTLVAALIRRGYIGRRE
ncbi:MAG: hypothetical protein JSW05_11470 [Candidatus Thorarchaeota archaeon]|nr:MAG: hypothetical protein JSW05_11470 [Candidatus Thorarchaeota archaeon]